MIVRDRFANTVIHEAAKMAHFSDKDILKNSRGEVKRESANKIRCNDKGTEFDPVVFGEFDDENILAGSGMGRIGLGFPIINANYLPKLPKILSMSSEDIGRIVYHEARIVIGSKDSGYPVGTVLSKYEYFGALECVDEDSVKFQTGAEAIETLLKARGFSTDEIILRYLPILPYPLRFKLARNGSLLSLGMEPLIRRIILRKCRMSRLVELDAPDIITLNEKVLLQKVADAYINNGLSGEIWYDSGRPMRSLQDVARFLDGECEKPWSYDLFKNIDFDSLKIVMSKVEELNSRKRLTEKMVSALNALYEQAKGIVINEITAIAKRRYPECGDSIFVVVEEGINAFMSAVGPYPRCSPVCENEGDMAELLLGGIVPAMDLRVRHLKAENTSDES